MTAAEAVRDALARVVFAREALELGEYAIATTVLRDLEFDLASVLDWPRCPDCGCRAPTQPLLDRHRFRDCRGVARRRRTP